MKKFFTLIRLLIVTFFFTIICQVVQSQNVPELLYYKFDASGTSVTNYASFPVGNNPASITGTGLSIGSTGLFGTALVGTGVASTGGVISTGWSTSFTTSFTIAFWTSNITTSSTLWYIWGDPGASTFRCFTNGVAGANNWMVRGGGLPDLLISGAATSSPNMIHVVYDKSAGEYRAYVNGTLNNTVTASTSITVSGTGFQIGGYSSSSNLSGNMDEFRIYSRALTQTEISSTYNKMLPTSKSDAGIVVITNPPDTFCSSNQSVTVTLKNFHWKPLTSVKIDWKINNNTQTQYSWSGTLAPQATTSVTLGSFNFSSLSSYNIVAYTSLPNNSADSVPANDTAKKYNLFVNPIPNATISAGGPTKICQGDSVLLTANSGTGLIYQWKLDGTDISGRTGQTLYALTKGAYSVLVTNSGNCKRTSSAVSVTVDTLPLISVTPGGPTTFCFGKSVQLNSTKGNGLTYQWKRDSINITSASNSSYTATLSGLYYVVIKKGGCKDSTSSVIVTVNPLPSKAISLSGPKSFCLGDSVVIKADTGSGLNYVWKKDGNMITGATSAFYTASTAGNYKVIITNSNSCTDSSANSLITVWPLPDTTVTTSGPTTFCLGSTVILNAKTGLGLNYKWKKDSKLIPGSYFSYLTANTTGSYKVVVTNNFGCADSSSPVSVMVNSLPIANVTPAGPISICDRDSVIINADTGTGYTYQWKRNCIDIPGAISIYYFAKTEGSYKVIVTNSNHCKDSSVANLVTIKPLPPSIITPFGPTTFCHGDSVILKANKTTGISYQWIKDGTNMPGAIDSLITVKTSGTYTLATTMASCTGISTPLNTSAITPAANLGKDTTICANKTIMLNPGAGNTSYLWSTGAISQTITVDSSGVGIGTKTIYVQVTLNGCIAYDTIKVTFMICPGIDEDGIDQIIRIYPNPSEGNFTMVFEKGYGSYDICINDLAGRLVYRNYILISNAMTKYFFDLTFVPTGIYTIRISNNSESRVEKLIIR